MNDMVKVECKCPCCGKISHVKLTENEWWRWQTGERIQNVVPTMSPEERELLISGVCNTCWNKMFGGNE